jgi:acetolactate synthase I/II/III large subunit
VNCLFEASPRSLLLIKTRRLNPSHKPGREHPINFLPKIRKVNV